jgi:hypothetical protein
MCVLLTLVALCGCLTTVCARAQSQEPEDPEDEKRFGLWLDQGISIPLTKSTSVETEFHQRFDEGASDLFEYFFQGGVAFRPRSWLTLIPIYRYQRFPGNPRITYENRLLFNCTLSAPKGPVRYSLRTLVEGRFPDDRPASARLRFRPGIEYTLPLPGTWRPVVVTNNEFFLVPWYNPFANGGSAYTQNRFQVGIRLPVTSYLSVRPYYLLQSVNLPAGWETNEIIGISAAVKIPRKVK